MRATRGLGVSTVAVLVLVGGTVGAARPANADEPVAAREPNLMSETAEITSVVDAFDKDDPFDLNLLVGFQQSWKNAKIRRETMLQQPGLSNGTFVPATENVASYSSSMSTLLVGADVGIYKDLALVFRLPIILNWSQSLGDLDGSAAVAGQRLADPSGTTAANSQLFSVPFNSPNRSGVDYFSAGLDWAIFNQQRDATKPTWVIGVEGRFPVGNPLHACNATPGYSGLECPNPSDPTQNRDPGISRGMYSVLAKSVWSRRFGYVEPYSGFFFQADFPKSDSDFGMWNPQANLERTPPLLGSFALGLEVVPWEHREQFQRVSADFRFLGTYHSPGRDYSELFDALGSSQAASLRSYNPSGYMANPAYPGMPGQPAPPQSIADPSAEKVYFSGITEQQAFGSYTLSASATYQAGQYIKFTVGSAFTYVQSHLVTSADTCNPGPTATVENAGPCVTKTAGGGTTVNGVPNPDHRDIIDLPGHRFSVDDTTMINLYVMGTVMF
jgi:hypothetical protein